MFLAHRHGDNSERLVDPDGGVSLQASNQMFLVGSPRLGMVFRLLAIFSGSSHGSGAAQNAALLPPDQVLEPP